MKYKIEYNSAIDGLTHEIEIEGTSEADVTKKLVDRYKRKPSKILSCRRVEDMKDERLSPMTYHKLKELGVKPQQWANWTQEQANNFIANKSKTSVGKKEESGKEKGSSSKETVKKESNDILESFDRYDKLQKIKNEANSKFTNTLRSKMDNLKNEDKDKFTKLNILYNQNGGTYGFTSNQWEKFKKLSGKLGVDFSDLDDLHAKKVETEGKAQEEYKNWKEKKDQFNSKYKTDIKGLFNLTNEQWRKEFEKKVKGLTGDSMKIKDANVKAFAEKLKARFPGIKVVAVMGEVDKLYVDDFGKNNKAEVIKMIQDYGRKMDATLIKEDFIAFLDSVNKGEKKMKSYKIGNRVIQADSIEKAIKIHKMLDSRIKDGRKASVTVYARNNKDIRDLDIICKSLNTKYKVLSETPTEMKIELDGNVSGVLDDLKSIHLLKSGSLNYIDSVEDDDFINNLSEEEKQAIEDYRKAIAGTNDPKLLELYAHILREEVEHLDELQNAAKGEFEEDSIPTPKCFYTERKGVIYVYMNYKLVGKFSSKEDAREVGYDIDGAIPFNENWETKDSIKDKYWFDVKEGDIITSPRLSRNGKYKVLEVIYKNGENYPNTILVKRIPDQYLTEKDDPESFKRVMVRPDSDMKIL